MADYINNIVNEIENERCVLILGPDIIDFGEKSFFETMWDQITKNPANINLVDETTQYLFVNDYLVQLQPGVQPGVVRRMMQNFYEDQVEFQEPLIKIAQIPFHLIISLMPDNRLHDIFEKSYPKKNSEKTNPNFNFSYYPLEVAPEQVEPPTKEKPLVYMLLGDFKQGDAIITFDNLFAFLSGIMGKRELPQNLLIALMKARTFIFLGVHFEKWYVQLLLKIIAPEQKEKYTILKNASNNDLCTFIARRLSLEFLPTEPLQFLTELYNKCKTRNLLKINPHVGSVFISYSHQDKSIVQKLSTALKEKNIKVIIDDFDMNGGEKIDDFINIIKDVDIVVPIISHNSLLSPWVIKEIYTAITSVDKYLMPCNLDETLFDKDFIMVAEKISDEKLREIGNKIIERGKNSLDDLFSQSKDQSHYISNLPIVVNELRNRKYISINDSVISDNFSSVVNEIYKIIERQ